MLINDEASEMTNSLVSETRQETPAYASSPDAKGQYHYFEVLRDVVWIQLI
jgi:hypothetical protein